MSAGSRLLPLGIGLLSLGAVVWLVWLDRVRVSPGPLSAAHAQVDELTGAQSCERCHGGGGTTLAEACGVCHPAELAGVRDGTGVHGREEVDERCGACHSEHHGTSFELAGALAFERAGIAEPRAFDHALHAGIDFRLHERHAELACPACHAHADAPFPPAGEPRFGGVTQACTSCHADVHEGAFALACEACHDQAHPFAQSVSFAHADPTIVGGAHARAACRDCHVDGGPLALDVVAARKPPARTEPLARTLSAAARACGACHDSPHGADFLAAVAATSSTAPDATCATCHADDAGRAGPGTFADARREPTAALHGASGFELEPPHAARACADCHAAGFAPPVGGSRAGRCDACHGDPHAGEFSAFDSRSCATCHLDTAFVPHAFDLELHALAAFVLDGAHEQLACERCHAGRGADAVMDALRFAGTPSACAECHLDVHANAFEGERCSACHTTHGFDAVERDSFDHARAGFALAGAHAAADCAACHLPASESGARATIASLAAGGGSATACSACHADVHREAFGAASCASCHRATRFDDVLPGRFDHGRDAGFALAGAHARVACETCHVPTDVADAHGRTFGRARADAEPERCSACHADPHAGELLVPASARADADACATCHVASSFRDGARDALDHDWTGFVLEGAHASVACDACHVVPARERELGRARGQRCADCHASPHGGQFFEPALGAADCARCHDTAGGLAFDHGRDTRFPLDARHAALDCGACHRPSATADGRVVVRYEGLGTTCGDCHGVGAGSGR